MQIWVDADACPAVIKDILFRAAERARVAVTLVSNMPLRIPTSPFIKTVRVPKGFDVADQRIAELVQPGDLVVTADIPLAAAVVQRGGHALDPRGDLYTADNVHERLAVRNLMDTLRGSGTNTSGPAAFRHGDRQAFANQLDRLLTARGRRGDGETDPGPRAPG
jgi:uncharacterized protein YaiI (UPF0178 family)